MLRALLRLSTSAGQAGYARAQPAVCQHAIEQYPPHHAFMPMCLVA